MRRITRMNFLLGGVLIIGAALTQPRDVALGIAVGVALTCVNFLVLSGLIGRWTSDAAKGTHSGSASMLMMPKMILLMLAVVAALEFLPIDAAGFAIGYSTFVLSIMIEAVYANLAPEPEPVVTTGPTGTTTDATQPTTNGTSGTNGAPIDG
ncbi:MAG: ATP synthase subunit I [Deltaproteobacteria bacterium]|nr:ATP synthase subunit I [Deltaproteobacteria bacterium]